MSLFSRRGHNTILSGAYRHLRRLLGALVSPSGPIAQRWPSVYARAITTSTAVKQELRRRPRVSIAGGIAALCLVVSIWFLAIESDQPTNADAVAYDGRSPREPNGADVRVMIRLPRPALGELPNIRQMPATQRRDYVRSLQAESKALRSALKARGIELSDVRTYSLIWNGFAATIPASEQSAVASLGARVQPVRRFYPASSEPVPADASDVFVAHPTPHTHVVALLDTGVATQSASLRQWVVPGFDVIERRAESGRLGVDPRNPRRQELSGTALAGVLASYQQHVLPVRIAHYSTPTETGTPEVFATTDTLLAGLEYAVNPSGDLSATDRVPLALIGVNAPYAGFSESVEAQATHAATALGTLVVAGVGNEGKGSAVSDANGSESPLNGTVGSPASAPDVVAVGALSAQNTLPRIALKSSSGSTNKAVLLGGTVTPGDHQVVIVEAGKTPMLAAARAAARGATLVVLAQPRSDRPLTAVPSGRINTAVIGVTGPAAKKLLRCKRGCRMRVGSVQSEGVGRAVTRASASEQASQFSSTGPTLSGEPKPDVAAAGVATSIFPDGKPAVVGGSAVAAARLVGVLGQFLRTHPTVGPDRLRAAVLASVEPDSSEPVHAVGAGAIRGPIQSGHVIFGRPKITQAHDTNKAAVEVSLAKIEEAKLAARFDASNAQQHFTVTPSPIVLVGPAGGSMVARFSAAASHGLSQGRFHVYGPENQLLGVLPWMQWLHRPKPVSISDVRLTLDPSKKVSGVRFSLGAFKRGDADKDATRIDAAQHLDLELVDAKERVVEKLTPAGGANELLPGEYAYRLDSGAIRKLAAGRYAFRVTATAPGSSARHREHSPWFSR